MTVSYILKRDRHNAENFVNDIVWFSGVTHLGFLIQNIEKFSQLCNVAIKDRTFAKLHSEPSVIIGLTADNGSLHYKKINIKKVGNDLSFISR